MTDSKITKHDPEKARVALLMQTVKDARECAERGEWDKVKLLVLLGVETVKDLPKKAEGEQCSE